MDLHEYASIKFVKVIDGMERDYPQAYRNAFKIPMFFYLENSITEAKEKLIAGFCGADYKIPEKEIKKSIREREKKNCLLIEGFENHDNNLIIEGLKAGADKQIIFDYSKGMGGKLTMWQGWILQELHKVKNHGFGIYELV